MHNLKYSLTGHLFQNRYKSEVVEDDTYFLTVLRYIHQNPLKAGLVQDPADYKWSSYKYYIDEQEQDLVSVEMGKGFFESQDGFVEFMRSPNKDQCLDYEVKIKYRDDELKNEILKTHKPELIDFIKLILSTVAVRLHCQLFLLYLFNDFYIIYS